MSDPRTLRDAAKTGLDALPSIAGMLDQPPPQATPSKPPKPPKPQAARLAFKPLETFIDTAEQEAILRRLSAPAPHPQAPGNPAAAAPYAAPSAPHAAIQAVPPDNVLGHRHVRGNEGGTGAAEKTKKNRWRKREHAAGTAPESQPMGRSYASQGPGSPTQPVSQTQHRTHKVRKADRGAVEGDGTLPAGGRGKPSRSSGLLSVFSRN
jgi:hypothetical protein